MFSRPLTDASDARNRARRILPRLVFDYIDGAAGAGRGESGNRAALQSLPLPVCGLTFFKAHWKDLQLSPIPISVVHDMLITKETKCPNLIRAPGSA